MDSWVTDTFYSHFPSYGDQKTQRDILLKSRHLEYQNHLHQLAAIEKLSAVRASKRFSANNNQMKRPKIPDEPIDNAAVIQINERNLQHQNDNMSLVRREHDALFVESCDRDDSRNRFLNELQNMDLPDMFNDVAIEARNRRTIEEQNRNKIQYQRELLAQIDQKRREKERRKAKEIEDDERLTRKMEEQLRLVRLQDERERQRQTREREHKRINIEMYTNNQQTAKTTKQSQNDTKTKSPRKSTYNDRKAQSENGKENLVTNKTNDTKLYKYFTNSARDANDFRNIRYNNNRVLSEDEEEESNSMSSSYNPNVLKTNMDQYCKNCQIDLDQPLCNFCQQNRYLVRNQLQHTDRDLLRCTACYHREPICISCRKEICVRCQKPTKINEVDASVPKMRQKLRKNTELNLNRSPRRQHLTKSLRKDVVLYEESYADNESEGPDDETFNNYKQISSTSSPRKLHNEDKPYSFNVDRTSVFHPAKLTAEPKLSVSVKNGEVLVEHGLHGDLNEIKRITKEKLSNYARNYGDMRLRNSSLRNRPVNMDTFLRPLIPEHLQKDSNNQAHKLYDQNSLAFKQLESKWEIPVVQKNNLTLNSDKNECVFTQVGAFRKQLQLDFDEDDDDFFTYK